MDFSEAKTIINNAISGKNTVIIVGKCKVKYHGRAASKLAEGERIVIVKSDGSFLVHQNKNLAAINYQPPKGIINCELGENLLVLRARREKPKELLEAVFSKIFSCQSFKLKDDSSLKVFGTEEDLSNLLMQDLERIEPGLVPLKQESGTLRGYIDVFARDREGNIVLVEVKRRTATLNAVSQLKRYVEETAKRKNEKVRGILVAPAISPNALAFLEKEGLQYVKLDYEVSNPSARITGLTKKQKEITDFSSD